MTNKQVVLKQLQATPMIATVELFKPVRVRQDLGQWAGRHGTLLNQALRRQKQEQCFESEARLVYEASSRSLSTV